MRILRVVPVVLWVLLIFATYQQDAVLAHDCPNLSNDSSVQAMQEAFDAGCLGEVFSASGLPRFVGMVGMLWFVLVVVQALLSSLLSVGRVRDWVGLR